MIIGIGINVEFNKFRTKMRKFHTKVDVKGICIYFSLIYSSG